MRWNLYSSSVSTLSATGLRSTRIAPRSREKASWMIRRLRASLLSAPACQYWR